MQTLTTRMVRELKGCAISILLLSLLDPQPHKAKWYKMMSGYANAAVTDALAYLTETGWMLKSPRGWMLASDKQMILSTELSTGFPQVDSSNHANHDSSDLVVSSSYIKDSKDLIDLTTTTRDKKNHAKHDLLKKTCIELGIKEPKASQLAELDITPEYIKAHVNSGVDLALAIYRIQARWKAPKQKKDPFGKDNGFITCESCGSLIWSPHNHGQPEYCSNCLEDDENDETNHLRHQEATL